MKYKQYKHLAMKTSYQKTISNDDFQRNLTAFSGKHWVVKKTKQWVDEHWMMLRLEKK